jgi:uncharacterized protein
MIIDMHCHYTLTACRRPDIARFSFEPASIGGVPQFDSWIAPRLEQQLKWRCLRKMMGIDPRLPIGAELDRQVQAFYDLHLLAEGPIERYVLLAFDDYHDERGVRPAPPVSDDVDGGDIYTSNSLIRELCRERRDRFLFGASVHPYRSRAAACVREVRAAGAVLLKWLPLHQNIDITDPRTIDVLRTCAEIGLPVLVHYGQEFTLATQHREFQSVRPLLGVLRRLRREGVQPTVIVAHVATPISPLGETDSHETLLEALEGEFADAPLFADISALTAWGKVSWLRQMRDRRSLHAKLLFGTDFPVPVADWRLRRDLGAEYQRIRGCSSWTQKVAAMLTDMGFGSGVFHRFSALAR